VTSVKSRTVSLTKVGQCVCDNYACNKKCNYFSLPVLHIYILDISTVLQTSLNFYNWLLSKRSRCIHFFSDILIAMLCKEVATILNFYIDYYRPTRFNFVYITIIIIIVT